MQSRRTSLLSRPWALLAGASVGVVLVAVGLFGIARISRRAKATAAPGFVLRDQNGRLTSLAQFRGKVVALTFIDPDCTQICPLTTRSMTRALELLGPNAASGVQLLGIDANPDKTQITDVTAYTNSHELQNRWRFLTGSLPQLRNVWRSYHVYVGSDNGDVEHQAVVILIDANGYERDVYSTPMSYEAVGDQAHSLAAGIARLLPGHPSTLTDVAEGDAAPLFHPTESVKLVALGPKPVSVSLGGGQPHLMLFFAGWLGKRPDLSVNLAVLDRYADQAQRRGWPAPVAVDVLTTEPSTTAAHQVLAQLATILHTPIVEDASGRYADAYEVADLPWFVLTSPSGKVLWSHDGWLSAASLERQVGTALHHKGPITVASR